MNRSPLRVCLLIPFALGCFALSPTAQAVVPAPDGGYPGGNTAEGDDALFNLDTSQGVNNTAICFEALFSNTTGRYNTANGYQALYNDTTGQDNTASGFGALEENTTGNENTANGVAALASNTTGINNTATGGGALLLNTTGFNNTATGFQALYSNTGSNNTAYGNNALFNNTTGNSNIALGNAAGINLTTGKNNIDIGNAGVAGETNKIRIGTAGMQKATFIAGISGVTVPAGVGVIVGSDGKLGTVVSSARFKDGIKPIRPVKLSPRSNQSPSITSRKLTPMASRNSALWRRTWKKWTLL